MIGLSSGGKRFNLIFGSGAGGVCWDTLRSTCGGCICEDTGRDTCGVWRGDTCNGCLWRTTAEDCARRCLPRLLWTYAVTMISGTMLSYAPLTPEWAGVSAISSCAVPDCRSCVSGESGRRRTPEEFGMCRTRLRDSRN